MPVIVNNPFFTACDELFHGRGGTAFSATGERTHVKKFRVIVRRVDMDDVAVCRCPYLPRPFELFIAASGVDGDLNAFCIELKAEPEYQDDWQNWIVTATYSNKLPASGIPNFPGYASQQQGQENNPELQKPEVSWDYEEAHVALPDDLDGKAFLNSTGQPFTPAITIPTGVAILCVEFNMLQYSEDNALKYSYATNISTFLGKRAGSWLCMPPKAKVAWIGERAYWRVSVRLKLKRFKRFDFSLPADRQEVESWQPRVLDQGLCRIETQPLSPNWLRPVPIYREHHVLTQMVPLDGHGQPVVPNNDGTITPVFIQFRTYQEMDFSKLLTSGLGPYGPP